MCNKRIIYKYGAATMKSDSTILNPSVLVTAYRTGHCFFGVVTHREILTTGCDKVLLRQRGSAKNTFPTLIHHDFISLGAYLYDINTAWNVNGKFLLILLAHDKRSVYSINLNGFSRCVINANGTVFCK